MPTKGGGSPHVSKVNKNPKIGPTSLENEILTLGDIAQWASSIIGTPLSLGNWAANLATGGAALPAALPTPGQEPFGGVGTQEWAVPGGFAGDVVPGGLDTNVSPTENPVGPGGLPGISRGGGTTGPSFQGDVMAVPAGGVIGMDPYSSLGIPSGTWAAATPPAAPAQQSAMTPSAAPAQQGSLSPSQTQSLLDAGYVAFVDSSGQEQILRRGQTYQIQPGDRLVSGQMGNRATVLDRRGGSPLGLSAKTMQDFFGGGLFPSSAGGAAAGGPSAGGAGAGGPGMAMNPLETEWANILAQENVAREIPQIQRTTQDILAPVNTEATNLFNAVNSPTGLTPQQQAYVKQATEAGKAKVAQQMGSEGLTGSTQNAMLQEEVEQSGAATAGSLQQGNIQLLQAAQKLAMGGQELELGEQSMLETQLSNIASQAGGVQSTLYAPAIQGYGLLGQFLNQILAPMGMQMQGWQDQINADVANANTSAQLAAAELSSQANQAQSMGGLFQGLGSIFGMGGGGMGGATGGIFGGLGAMLGGGSAAAGGAGETVASLAPLVVGMVACWVAREVYGNENPKWIKFRHWMLNKSPAWFRNLYYAKGERFALWIHDKPILKSAVRTAMNLILRYG